MRATVLDDGFQRGFSAVRGEVGDLWFECTRIRGGCIDDGDAKLGESLVNPAFAQMQW